MDTTARPVSSKEVPESVLKVLCVVVLGLLLLEVTSTTVGFVRLGLVYGIFLNMIGGKFLPYINERVRFVRY